MARLKPTERDALRKFAGSAPIEQPRHQNLPIAEFIKSISNLPDSMRPTKPVRFVGKDWKL